MKEKVETLLQNWIEREKAASKLSAIVNDLWFNKSVELVLFRKKLFDKGIELILQHHRLGRQITKKDIYVFDTLAVASAIQNMDIIPSKIDIGILASEWFDEGKGTEIDQFVANKLSEFTKKDKFKLNSRDVVLYGFGRIGRITARLLINSTGKGEQLRLRAIVIRGKMDNAQIQKRAELLRNDSIYGPFRGTVDEDYENQGLIVNGQFIKLINSEHPSDVDYMQYGIHNALLIDNTGVWRDREGLNKHLEANGISKVLLTAPGKGDIPNVVFGVNHDHFDVEKENIFSAASCTTNAIVPTLKIVDEQYGIEFGHIETVHSYTNDQNLLDNYHKKYRRGRAAALNLVITETGAGSAVSKILPQLKGKLTGNAVRIPTPDGSLAILNLTLKKDVTKDELNSFLKKHSMHGSLVEQLDFSENEELVSSDIIRDSHAGIIDGAATIVNDNRRTVVIYVWYDNEWGYTEQVIRYAKHIAGVRRPTYL